MSEVMKMDEKCTRLKKCTDELLEIAAENLKKENLTPSDIEFSLMLLNDAKKYIMLIKHDAI